MWPADSDAVADEPNASEGQTNRHRLATVSLCGENANTCLPYLEADVPDHRQWPSAGSMAPIADFRS